MGGIFIIYLLIILLFFGLAYLPKMKAIKDVFLACRDLKKLHKVLCDGYENCDYI